MGLLSPSEQGSGPTVSELKLAQMEEELNHLIRYTPKGEPIELMLIGYSRENELAIKDHFDTPNWQARIDYNSRAGVYLVLFPRQ